VTANAAPTRSICADGRYRRDAIACQASASINPATSAIPVVVLKIRLLPIRNVGRIHPLSGAETIVAMLPSTRKSVFCDSFDRIPHST
jgi:hypothetical protein